MYHYVITIQYPVGRRPPAGRAGGLGLVTQDGLTEIRPGETRSAVFGRLREHAVRTAKSRYGMAEADMANSMFFSLEPEDLTGPVAGIVTELVAAAEAKMQAMFDSDSESSWREESARWAAAKTAAEQATVADPLLFAREEIDAANDAAMLLLKDELGLGERDTDLLQLHVAAAAAKLTEPDITLDAVIECSYDGVPSSEVRGWWNGWA